MPHWTRNTLGSYIDGKWYLRNGTEEYYQYVMWMDIQKPEELKTSEEWGTIYNQVIVLDPDGWDRNNFQYSWHEERISELEYALRLLSSTVTSKV